MIRLLMEGHGDGAGTPTPSPADELRQAAETLRERAGKAMPATMHPGVALALAEWLEAEAEAHIHVPGQPRVTYLYDLPLMARSPSARLARLINGGAS